LVNRNVSLSILVIGSVFALLTYLKEQTIFTALTILYLTISILVLLRLYEEWRWFRSHDAPLASGLFIGTLTFLGLGSSLFSQYATLHPYYDIEQVLIEVSINLSLFGIDNLLIYLNVFGLVFSFVFVILLLLLLRNYFTGRYPVMFLFRRSLAREMPIIYSGLLALGFVFLWLNSNVIEVNALIFTGTIIGFFVETYLIKMVSVSLQYVIPSSASSSRSARSSQRISSSRSNSSRHRSRNSSRANRSTTTSRNSRNTNPSTTTPSRRTSSVNTANSRSTSSKDVRVVPGIDTGKSRRTIRLSKSTLKRIIPKGRKVTLDDFRCIFCYEFPVDGKVVICPHCRHPAHEYEFDTWNAVSHLCSRCNKEITTKNMIRMSGSDYRKLIKFYQKKKSKL